jgi:hypothetical protein
MESDWRVIDRALRSIAERRCALDAEEAKWLREAEAVKIWKQLGMVSALDYCERVLGYAPRAAHDRLRVARALGELPQMTDALATGELAFTAVRELTRVATAETEDEWVERARDKNVRQIEDLVAGHKRGDRPDDPKDPALRKHVVVLELDGAAFAEWRQARTLLEDEHGGYLDDTAFVKMLAAHVFEEGEPSGKARCQLAVTVCESCRAGWQDGGGVRVPISAADVARAECDAIRIGSLDAEAPERAQQDIPPATARLVWHRDGGRCRAPGCRSAHGLEIHHIVHREHGGGHELSNLVLLCSACHHAHHEGLLEISGTSDDLIVTRTNDVRAHVGTMSTAGTSDDLAVRRTNDVRAHVGTKAISGTSDDVVAQSTNDVRAHVGTKAVRTELEPVTMQRLEAMAAAALAAMPPSTG